LADARAGSRDFTGLSPTARGGYTTHMGDPDAVRRGDVVYWDEWNNVQPLQIIALVVTDPGDAPQAILSTLAGEVLRDAEGQAMKPYVDELRKAPKFVSAVHRASHKTGT